MNDKVEITKEYLDYLERALKYAVDHGFKITIFDDGVAVGFQG